MNVKLTCYISLITIFMASILGSSMVFFLRKNLSEKTSLIINGMAAGIMFSASIFGLIIPSMNTSKTIYYFQFIPVIIGIIIGCLFLFSLDLILSKTHQNKSSIKLFVALTSHNIPEGIAIGLAFSLAVAENAYLFSALSLTLGIALQNIPENLALSLSLYNTAYSKRKSFLLGVLSSIVEPIFGLIFFYLSININHLLPWFLSFAGGSMIYLTLDELIPGMKKEGLHPYGVWSFIIGFCLMIILECL